MIFFWSHKYLLPMSADLVGNSEIVGEIVIVWYNALSLIVYVLIDDWSRLKEYNYSIRISFLHKLTIHGTPSNLYNRL